MKRRHVMPFGAELDGGTARFRLWAPACGQVRLEIGRDNDRRVIAMQALEGGWHCATLDGLAAGTPYAFRVDEGAPVPDPASRFNPWDVDGPSALVDPTSFEWDDEPWAGRPWSEAVVYELHVGTFTPEGTFLAAIGKLDHLASLGVTALEILPVADFAGRRNWGYDGVLPFAPDSAYGTPEDLKRLVSAAHKRGLMVLLDVVYNHFGPEGNHLSRYAPQFFNAAHQTPWGAAINFDGEASATVRDFFVHNATYWIDEFHFDGLRLDAVHAIADDSPRHIVRDIAAAIARSPGRQRHVHLVLENDRNESHFLERGGQAYASGTWNDDFHHAMHVLVTGETESYYGDYAVRPAWSLGRTLAEGFAFQGEPSRHRQGEERGEPSAHLPPEAFVPFLQNHDQIGNRAFGERLSMLASVEAQRLATATLLLGPSVPMLFQGEEFASSSPFLYFCDFHGELADAVREGRRKEFASFTRFRDPEVRGRIPDPNAVETFEKSKLPWDEMKLPGHREALERHRELLRIRAHEITPRIPGPSHGATFAALGNSGLRVDWTLGDGSRLHLRANFSAQPLPVAGEAPGGLLHSEGTVEPHGLGPWSGAWTLEPA
jgi:maltooligosyltrehalose trehalohydrolase